MSATRSPTSRGTSSTSGRPDDSPYQEPSRSFQIFKTNALGLNAPSGFEVLVHPTGGSACTPSPAFHSSKLRWKHQRYFLPPSFRLFFGGSVAKTADAVKHPVATVKYKGWEGLIGLRAEIEIDAKTEAATHGNRNPISGRKSSVLIRRTGIGREYVMRISGSEGHVFMWKGSKSALNLLDKSAPSCNGNLKMIQPKDPERILAIWRNRTDHSILGALILLEEFDEGSTGLLLEVLAACLTIVLAERMTARGWLGGFGKQVS